MEEPLIVGPRPCDKHRKSREDNIKKVWSVIVGDIEAYLGSHLVIKAAVDLYREALSAYENGAYMATVLMANVAIEALLYDVAAAIGGKPYCHEGDIYEVEPNIKIYDARLNEVLRLLRRQGIADKGLISRVERLRSKRNIVSHYSQKHWKVLEKELKAKMKARAPNKPYVRLEGLEAGIWAGSREALETLEEAARIFREIISKFHTRACSSSI